LNQIKTKNKNNHVGIVCRFGQKLSHLFVKNEWMTVRQV
jgi:hypothetical protein